VVLVGGDAPGDVDGEAKPLTVLDVREAEAQLVPPARGELDGRRRAGRQVDHLSGRVAVVAAQDERRLAKARRVQPAAVEREGVAAVEGRGDGRVHRRDERVVPEGAVVKGEGLVAGEVQLMTQRQPRRLLHAIPTRAGLQCVDRDRARQAGQQQRRFKRLDRPSRRRGKHCLLLRIPNLRWRRRLGQPAD